VLTEDTFGMIENDIKLENLEQEIKNLRKSANCPNFIFIFSFILLLFFFTLMVIYLITSDDMDLTKAFTILATLSFCVVLFSARRSDAIYEKIRQFERLKTDLMELSQIRVN
jgi:hypothetical protein